MSLIPRVKGPERDPKNLPVKIIICRVFGKLEFFIDISKEHNMKITLGEYLYVVYFAFCLFSFVDALS